MKNIYTPAILLFVIVAVGCSKDFLKRYDERIIGTWRISDVNRNGFGGNLDNLPFREGTFTFNDGGTLTYLSPANVTYQGSWDIIKKTIGDQTIRTLEITVVNYVGQSVLAEYYDDMNFVSTNHFKARIHSGMHTYVTHFRR